MSAVASGNNIVRLPLSNRILYYSNIKQPPYHSKRLHTTILINRYCTYLTIEILLHTLFHSLRMCRNKAKRYRIIAALLLLLFAHYWCGISLFTHSHVVNGVVVVHSHPYKAEHAHTQSQIKTIFQLSTFQTLGDASPCIELPFWLIPLWSITFACSYSLPRHQVTAVYTRGPPYFPL